MSRPDFDAPDDDDDDDDNIDNLYLTFEVGPEQFALHVAHVTEIVRLQKIFAVPDVPLHIRGVINLRGKVIPLLDVRARFGIDQVAYTDRTVVVVIEVDDTPTGLVVDRVFGIAELAPDEIEPAPATCQPSRTSLVTSVCKRGDNVTFIVDVPTLVNAPPIHTPASGPRSDLSRERAAQ